jgi:hypothetical protein
MLTDFHEDEAKKSKMADLKKLSYSKQPILNIFSGKFQDFFCFIPMKISQHLHIA